MGMEQHLEQLKREHTQAQRELDLIAELQREFPDLETDVDRWGYVRYMAKSANPRVTDVMFERNCGCCFDSPLHARPYLKLANGTLIYSNPCNVTVGQPDEWSDGFREYEWWRKTYEGAGVAARVIKSIQRHIDYLSCKDDD